jgi:N-acetylglucosaminyldiphosphoundecaprenol N-acetyl-beta-D-mannosaminyltransferase
VHSLDVLGVRVDDVTYEEALALIDGYIGERAPHAVVTPNPEFVILARRDAAFRTSLNAAALAIPDGIGLLMAARLFGTPLREHVRGTDLVLRLAERSVGRGYRWFLLGAANGVAEEAAAMLRSRFPGLLVAGSYAGHGGPRGDSETRAAVVAAGPIDIILVAYGAGKQEAWMQRNLAPLGIPVGLGIGGVLNYLAGRSPRAPVWMRRLELEWLHRLLAEPWRWRRQLALPKFLALVCIEAARRRGAKSPSR